MSDVISYSALLQTIAARMAQTRGVKRVQTLRTLSEGVPDLPLLQIYCNGGETDVESRDTGQSTFRAGVRQTLMTVVIDGYARQRSNVGQDMEAQLGLADAIDEQLTAQQLAAYFGEPSIRAFRWSWERVTLVHGDGSAEYAGVRFTLELTVY